LRYENPSHALEPLSVLGRREQLDARLDLIEQANLADERISRLYAAREAAGVVV
jgi:hypothetical protein